VVPGQRGAIAQDSRESRGVTGPVGEPGSDPVRNRPQLAIAASVLLILLGLFFGRPLLHLRSEMYSFSDFLQPLPLFNVQPGHVPANRMMEDPAVQIIPWTLLNRRSIRRGHVPLWNRYNGGGMPELANYQSGVFSIFNIPFYLLPVRIALIVSPFLKLMGFGIFTFLFLREIKISTGPALVGAVTIRGGRRRSTADRPPYLKRTPRFAPYRFPPDKARYNSSTIRFPGRWVSRSRDSASSPDVFCSCAPEIRDPASPRSPGPNEK